MNWREQRIAVIDTETTGVDVAIARVVEVGVLIVERGEFVDRKSWLVNPGVPIPAECTEVHGITDADVAGKPAFGEIAVDLALFVEGAIPAGYNARFDRAQLLAEYFRAGLLAPSFLQGGDRTGWLDVLAWARASDPWAKGSGRFKLGAVAARLGVEVGTAHRALGDCETSARVLNVLQSRRLAPESGLTRIPDDWDDLQLHQRRLSAENEADFLGFIARKRAKAAQRANP